MMNEQKINEIWNKANTQYYQVKAEHRKLEIIFAEMIVQECLQVISKSDATCSDEWDYAERDLHGLIKSHFGEVKE